MSRRIGLQAIPNSRARCLHRYPPPFAPRGCARSRLPRRLCSCPCRCRPARCSRAGRAQNRRRCRHWSSCRRCSCCYNTVGNGIRTCGPSIDGRTVDHDARGDITVRIVRRRGALFDVGIADRQRNGIRADQRNFRRRRIREHDRKCLRVRQPGAIDDLERHVVRTGHIVACRRTR